MISNRIQFFLHVLTALALLLGALTAPPSVAERAAGPDGAQTERLTPEQAIAVALNDLQATADGYRLRHPLHVATFTPDGLQFTPRRGGPEWAWQLMAVGAGDAPLPRVELGTVRPVHEQPGVVAYSRGGLIEQYLARQGGLEQQFIVPRPLTPGGADLVIAGAVRSAGVFGETEDGWQWRTAEGAVRLGGVRAYDATGRDLPATMEARATETRIVVDGEPLARAAYPVTIDPEIGANDFRLSDMGGVGSFEGWFPAVAYNSTEDEYLVVWYGNGDTGSPADEENEIYGQLVDAATGAEIGDDFRLSDMGPDGNVHYFAYFPAVAYNSANNEYLVVWWGLDTLGAEIFGQRVDAATGAEIGTNDFRLSDMGPDGSTLFYPAVAYNSADDEYLVVWSGDDGTGGPGVNEFEIFGQRVNAATGAEIGTNDFRLSDMGPDKNANYLAGVPAVAYNSTGNEYLVVWSGDDDTGGLVEGEFEIYGQRVSAATGAEIGANDFRLSDMGPDGNANYGAGDPAVVYNGTEDEYLVVWSGDDDTGGLVDEELEIYGQRVDAASGAEIGGNDFRLSDMGPDGDENYDAHGPAVAYNDTGNEYLVVWSGDDGTGALVDEELEIYGQRVDAASGAEIGGNDFRLSDMGPDGDANYDAYVSAVAYNSAGDEYLVVWHGDDDAGALADEKFGIFGQWVNAATGAEIGADFRLSDMEPDGDADYGAYSPAVAYNSTANEYLVVWYGDDDTGTLVEGELEIFGQRVDAATGAEIGADFRLSDMGPDGDASYDASSPAAAYNSTEDEYLVVWWGYDDTGAMVKGENEIYGQRVSASGTEIGTNDFRLSDMGPDGNANYDAYRPAVAYNSAEDEYLVVWEGDDDTGTLVDGESEIFGQRLSAAGAEIGANDFRLSDMGPDGEENYDAYSPAVAYNSAGNEYLVVWYGDDNTDSLVNEEREIFGQRVSATGAEIGGNDFRLSDMGPDGDENYDASDPAVAFNSTANEYMVVWCGDDTGGLVNNEYEIFGQRVNVTGTEIGTDFRLSDMGPDGNANYSARSPAVAYNSAGNEYMVVWCGDDDTGGLVSHEYEIFGQRVSATGTELGANDLRLSDMGPDGDANYDAYSPAVAYNSGGNEYLVVWSGDDDTGALVDEEYEIFGQRFDANYRLYLPLILRSG